MGLIQCLKDGQRYAERWPRHAVVAAFTESKVIPATTIATKMMPAFAVINLLVQWQFHGQDFTPTSVATSLFMLMLPLQGLYWLGKRAREPLTPQLQVWYQDLAKKLKQSDPNAAIREGKVTYMDLALLLRKILAILPPDEQ